jgi:hypothetical protein
MVTQDLGKSIPGRGVNTRLPSRIMVRIQDCSGAGGRGYPTGRRAGCAGQARAESCRGMWWADWGWRMLRRRMMWWSVLGEQGRKGIDGCDDLRMTEVFCAHKCCNFNYIWHSLLLVCPFFITITKYVNFIFFLNRFIQLMFWKLEVQGWVVTGVGLWRMALWWLGGQGSHGKIGIQKEGWG